MSDVEIPKTKFEFRYFVLEIVGTLAALIEEKDPFRMWPTFFRNLNNRIQ